MTIKNRQGKQFRKACCFAIINNSWLNFKEPHSIRYTIYIIVNRWYLIVAFQKFPKRDICMKLMNIDMLK